jgi:hypothetical protein
MKASVLRIALACSFAMYICGGLAQQLPQPPTTEVVVPAIAPLSASPQKVQAEKWLARDKFEMYFPSEGLLYQTYPKDGYTYMTGWRHICSMDVSMKTTLRIPTTYSVDEDGKLTLEFNMEKGCPHFKYVFTGTKGQIFLRDKSGNWNLRVLAVELKD